MSNSSILDIDLLVRPRLIDYHKILLSQADADFCIPFINEDIPLYIDPFLLWKSKAFSENCLHTALVDNFNYLGYLYKNGRQKEAENILIQASECSAVGLGTSKSKQGKKIGKRVASDILDVFRSVPQISTDGFSHIEEIQLLVDKISKDRISDFTGNLLSSHLRDYTIDQCEQYHIPIESTEFTFFDFKSRRFTTQKTYLPINPISKTPILFVPKHWLRHIPWINPDEYFSSYYPEQVEENIRLKSRYSIIDYNRVNYALVRGFIESKESSIDKLKSDPLFNQIPISSAKRALNELLELPTGTSQSADKKFEDLVCRILSSVLYPDLDFAKAQSRVFSGTQIRDLVFYNNRSNPFFSQIFDQYKSYQIVIEMKNVEKLSREHVSQVSRYLSDNFGNFGVIVTRNRPPRNIVQHIVDLWSGSRKCIVVLTDEDLKLMLNVYENKQRKPYEVLKAAFIELSRKFPQ